VLVVQHISVEWLTTEYMYIKVNIRVLKDIVCFCVSVVFAHRKKTHQADEIISKKYVIATDIYEFGPLLAGKSRDK